MGEATRKRARDGKKGRAEVKGECRGRSGHPESPPARQKASGEPAMKARPPRPSERKLHLKEPTKEKRDKKRRRRRRRRPRPRCRGGEGGEVGLGGGSGGKGYCRQTVRDDDSSPTDQGKSESIQ